MTHVCLHLITLICVVLNSGFCSSIYPSHLQFNYGSLPWRILENNIVIA